MRPLIVGLSWLCAPAAHRLDRALADPAAAQGQLVARLEKSCSRTTFGQSRGLDGSAGRFAAVAPSSWSDVAPFAARQREGEALALTPHAVVAWERTSGSGGAQKDVPYTAPMMAVFRRMFSAWAHDLITAGPHLTSGQFYFSISPPLSDAPEGGLDDDADYLAGWQRTLMGPWFVRPDLRGVRDGQGFKDATCLALLLAPRLEIISVWSPTFLLVMLEHIEARWPELLALVAQRDRARARTLSAFEAPPPPAVLWPQLRLISCWADGSAAAPAMLLQERFDGVLVQGKGLLATECPITIPRVALDEQRLGQVPLVGDVVVELLDDAGDVRPLTAGQQGQTYQVLVSTPGGLLRYRLGDVVEVRGKAAATPLLRLVGRADAVSDLVGEKLTEALVADALKQVAGFSVLVPHPSGRRYQLLTDSDDAGACERVERALLAAFHYRQARELGQLDAPELVHSPGAQAALFDAWRQSGRKEGDLKPSALVRVPLELKPSAAD